MTPLLEAYVQTQSGLWECNSTGYLGTPVSRQPIPVGMGVSCGDFAGRKCGGCFPDGFGTEVAVSLWTGHRRTTTIFPPWFP